MMAWTVHPGAVLSGLALACLIGWGVWRWSRRSEDPPGVLIVKLVLTVVLGGTGIWCGVNLFPLIGIPLAAVCGIVVGLIWGQNIGAAIARPLASLYDGGDEPPEPKPFYAIARAHWKQRRYGEAIQTIEAQLERFPDDPEGLLMLAEIRARSLEDWPGAEEAIDRLVVREDLPVPVRARALEALGDWRLDHGHDAEAARRTFQRTLDLFPGTPEAAEAAQRLAHVGTDAWRRSQGRGRVIAMVKGDERLGLRPEGTSPGAVQEPDPELETESLRQQLVEHPMDGEARERLALLYADRLGRMDWAVAEMETLLSLPNQTAKATARRLHGLADLHVRHDGNEEAARAVLGRIVTGMPGTALAMAAQSRLDHLRLEIRGRQSARTLGQA
ncbi:MAG: tetratricopeptide repeat protein [Verrucomicrobiae bacterium]|nr:tetratricopeptide repeat protein [Verrucomicrobiae bacterium]